MVLKQVAPCYFLQCRAMQTLKGGGGGAKGGGPSGGGGGASEGDGHDECDEYGCRLQSVGGTEIALGGVFPAGYSDDTNCRWFPLRVFNTIATHLAQTSKLYDQFQSQLNKVSRSPSTMQPMCPSGDDAVEEGGDDMQISAGHLVGLVLFGMTPMVGLYAAGILWRMRKARRDKVKKRIRDDDMKEARAMWAELDDDGNDIINGPELQGLADYRAPGNK
eukprot:gene2323-945_t